MNKNKLNNECQQKNSHKKIALVRGLIPLLDKGIIINNDNSVDEYYEERDDDAIKCETHKNIDNEIKLCKFFLESTQNQRRH